MEVIKAFEAARAETPDLTLDAFCTRLPRSELGNAYRLVLRHGDRLRFVGDEKNGNWMAYDGKSWSRNDLVAKAATIDMVECLDIELDLIRQEIEEVIAPVLADLDAREAEARAVPVYQVDDAPGLTKTERAAMEARSRREARARDKAIEAVEAERRDVTKRHADLSRKFEMHVDSSQRERAMEAAKSLSRSFVQADLRDFDVKSNIINTPGGTIDLRTGDVRPHDPADMLTGITPASPKKSSRKVFDAFFIDMCRDRDGSRNKRRESYIKRAVGYSIRGGNPRHLMFFMTGDPKDEKRNGRNGKSAFMNALVYALGEYIKRQQAQMIVIRDRKSPEDKHRFDLLGARIAFIAELNNDDVLCTSTAKALIGENQFHGRHLRNDPFTANVTFVLWVLSNHLPEMSPNEKAAVWGKIRWIILENFFWDGLGDEPEGHYQMIDTELDAKLRGEADGILDWVVEASLEYEEQGLGDFEEATDSVSNLHADVDVYADFLRTCTVRGTRESVPANELYDAYLAYCVASGVDHESQTAFGRALSSRGLGKEKKGTVKRTGIRLNIRGVALSRGCHVDSALGFVAEEVADGNVARVIRGDQMSPAELGAVRTFEVGEEFTLPDGGVFRITKPGEWALPDPGYQPPANRRGRR